MRYQNAAALAALVLAAGASACTRVDPFAPPPADLGRGPSAAPAPVAVPPAPAPAPGEPVLLTGVAAPSPLEGWKPMLVDPAGDHVGSPGGDILSVHAVTDGTYLWLRYRLAQAPSSQEGLPDLRFWVEKQPEMVTVEVKTGTPGNPCEISRSDQAEGVVVGNCFKLGEGIDIRLPLKYLPDWASKRDPFFVSGPQTCCADEARSRPVDEIDASQEVWRLSDEQIAERERAAREAATQVAPPSPGWN